MNKVNTNLPDFDDGDNQELSYRKMFPKKDLEKESLIKPFSLDHFQETIDYGKLVGNLLRRLWIVVLCGLIFGLLGYFILEPMLNLKKSFTATTQLLYKEQKRSVSEGSFNITTIKDMIVMKQNCQATKTLLNSPHSVDAIQGMSTVEVNKKSNFLSLRMTVEDPEDATKLANTLAEMAVKNNLSFYKQKAEMMLKNIRDKGEKASRDALDAEQKLVDFQKKHQLIDINATKKLLVQAQADNEKHLFETENLIKTNDRDLIALQTELKKTPKEIKRELTKHDFLTYKMQAVQGKIIELIAEYGEENPKVKKLQEELMLLKKAAANISEDKNEVISEKNPRIKELERMITQVEVNLEKAKLLVKASKDSLNSKLERLSELPKLQLQLDQLNKEKNDILTLVDLYEKKANEIEIHYRSPVADFEVYETATGAPQNRQIPQAVFLTGGVIFGSIISFLIILLMQIFDRRLFTQKEIEAHYNAPCLATVPKMHEAKLTMLNSPLSTYIQNMAEKIAQMVDDKGPQVLAFCSAHGQEGKSSLTSELSRYYSRLGLKTVYMDFNHRSNDFFENTMDISSFLDPERNIENLFATHDNLSKAKFEYSDNMHDYLKAMNSNQLIDQLKENHDVILIDSPGVLEEEYACNAIALADETVFVIKSGHNKKSEIDKAVKKLEDRGIYPLGIVLNAVDKRFVEK